MTLPDRLAAVSMQRTRDRGGRRRDVEQVLTLARHLDPAERFLIEQVYQHGVRIVDIARQSGRSRSSVQKLVHKLLRRMRTRRFAFMITQGDLLAPDVRRTAELMILRGRSLRQAARQTCRSLHVVRQHMLIVKALTRD